MVATADHIATSGKLSEDATNNLQGKYASCLYLATDAGTDKGVEPTGFVALASVSGVAARHVPVDVKVRSSGVGVVCVVVFACGLPHALTLTVNVFHCSIPYPKKHRMACPWNWPRPP